jgi:hypothetical protein
VTSQSNLAGLSMTFGAADASRYAACMGKIASL